MSSKAHKIRAAVFVLITGGLLAVVLVVFGGMRFWEHKNHYTVEFEDTVYGLEPGAQVYLDGIKVGRVDDIAVAKDDLSKVEVSITVKASAPVHTDTIALLQLSGITGLKVIDLRGGKMSTPALPSGSRIATGQTTLDKMAKKAEQLVDRGDELMQRATKILANLDAITDPKRLVVVDEILASTKTLAGNLTDASRSLNRMIAENRVALKATVGEIHGVAVSAREIIDGQVVGLVGRAGEVIGDLATLVRGSEGPIRSAVFDLRQASRNFKELSRDVRAKPSRLLFSSSPSERKLP